MNEEIVANEAPVKAGSIKKNFIFNLIYKLVAVLVPIIITPLLSRTLEADGNGVLSFVASIVSYFILFSNVGVETYGQRVIAIHRNDKAYLKKFAIEITIMRTILTVICLAIYYVAFISPLNDSYNTLYLIYGITLIAVAIDFSWFFQGVEDFKLLAITGVISKVLYIVLTIIFVKDKSDLALAAILTAGSTVLPFILTIPFLAKYAKGKIEGRINPFYHFKECMVYFIPTIAVQIYTIVDKTMIGLITKSEFENGYYEQAEKLVKLPMTIVMTLNIIMRSRISYYFSLNEHDKIRDLTHKSANFTFLLVIPMMLGMAAVANTFVPIYLGEGYDKCVTLIYVLSPLMLIIGVSNLIGTHYYTPFGKQNISNRFLIAGALVNVALNSFLIYFFKSIGAAIASVIAEFVITVLYIIFAKKFITIKELLKISVKYIIAGLVMFAVVFPLNMYLPDTIWYLILEVVIACAIYGVMLLILRTKFVLDSIKSALDLVKGKLGRK